jgi:hypothetical protein
VRGKDLSSLIERLVISDAGNKMYLNILNASEQLLPKVETQDSSGFLVDNARFVQNYKCIQLTLIFRMLE